MHKTAFSFIALASTASAALAATPLSPPAVESETTELRALVKDLQSQVDQLKAQNDTTWLTQQRADEIKGLVQDVLADADTRSSLLQSGAAAGWDKGFFIGSTDGNFLLKISGQIQARFVYNNQDNSFDENRSGFEMRRTKFMFKGHVLDPSWTYDIQFAADRSTGTVTIEDAGWIAKDLGSGWKATVGQMKAPFLREEIISSIRMMAIERSLVNNFFTAGTVQGLRLSYEADKIRAAVMYHDGNRTANTSWSAEDTEYAFSGRAEFLAMGAWKTLDDYASFKGDEQALVIGAAVNYSKGEYGTTFTAGPPVAGNDAETENLGLTVDATWDFGGFNLSGAFVYRNLDTEATGAEFDQYGFLIHAGFFLSDEWELYGQYEWADADIAGLDDLSVITVGVTRYWDRHNLKWQSDVGFGLDSVSSSFANDGAGWRTDSTDEDGQIVIRTQLQLVF